MKKVQTAAGLWMTEAIGVAVGLGPWSRNDRHLMALLILALELVVDSRIRKRKNN